MKKFRFLGLTGLLVSSFISTAQLSGTAFLSGQNNHNNIKVKFTAQSGMAVSDSTLTDINGNYTINIVNGIYTISFSRQGYIPATHNNGAATLLTNTVTLPSATLTLGNAVNVSGNVSGTWSNNNTYIVNSDITIPVNTTLVIQAGTKVRFNGYYTLTANGALLALGSSISPVEFTSNILPLTTSNWNRIKINNSASKIDHCVVEYCENGLNADNSSPLISNSVFRNMRNIALSLVNSSAYVVNNDVYNIINNQANAAIGINANSNNGAICLIECNRIYSVTSAGHNSYGIRAWDNTHVRDNEVHHISGSTSRGIDVGMSGAIIERNYIHHCGNGIQFYYQTVAPHPRIINNVIRQNEKGILAAGMSNSLHISNNIIINNTDGIVQGGGAAPNISYNLVWSNSGSNFQVSIAGIGQLISTNAQGNPVDAYYNLSQDPLLSANSLPIFGSGSPCLNAGNTIYSPHIGLQNQACMSQTGTITSVSSVDTDYSIVRVFPNPASNQIIVETNAKGKQQVEIYDMSGRLVINETLNDRNTVNVSLLGSGIYNLVLKNNNTSTNIKLVIQN